jgi:hypothetical protein
VIKIKSIDEIRWDISQISEYNLLFDELEQSALFMPEISMHISNHDFFHSRAMVSEIIEKKEINNRLANLTLNLASLNDAAVDDNKDKIKSKTSLILNNEYSSIKVIISELNSFKSKIDEFEKMHDELLKSNLISLDIKMQLEHDFKKKRQMEELYNKQKCILVDLSKVFVKLAKESVKNNR